MGNETERAALVTRARQQRAEIEQYFADLAHWNAAVRRPDEAPIDPDPDGIVARLMQGLDRLLAVEDARA